MFKSLLAVASVLVCSAVCGPVPDPDVEVFVRQTPGSRRSGAQFYPGDGPIGQMEYDDGYNNGFGYGARVGSRETRYANYLAYYGIGVYNGGGGFGRAECFQRCQQQGRIGCAGLCRSYG